MEAVKMDTTMEQELERSGALIVQNAKGLTITTNEDYERGNALLKDIKVKIKAVKDYWKEPKAAAQQAHKQLVAREGAMLKPLEAAESLIKRAMLEYTTAQEKAAREAAEAARRERESEARRLEVIAAQAEADGDMDTAEIMRDMAEAVPVAEVVQAAPKADLTQAAHALGIGSPAPLPSAGGIKSPGEVSHVYLRRSCAPPRAFNGAASISHTIRFETMRSDATFP